MPRKRLAAVIKRLKNKGKKVIFANGCFDIVHVGHVRFLRGARAKGDVLVVGLNSDKSVRKIKGKGRPLVSEKKRAELMAAFEFVDYITIFGEADVKKTLEVLRPTAHAKGTDYTAASVPESKFSRPLGIKTVITGDRKNHSTKDLIKDILRKHKK